MTECFSIPQPYLENLPLECIIINTKNKFNSSLHVGVDSGSEAMASEYFNIMIPLKFASTGK